MKVKKVRGIEETWAKLGCHGKTDWWLWIWALSVSFNVSHIAYFRNGCIRNLWCIQNGCTHEDTDRRTALVKRHMYRMHDVFSGVAGCLKMTRWMTGRRNKGIEAWHTSEGVWFRWFRWEPIVAFDAFPLTSM